MSRPLLAVCVCLCLAGFDSNALAQFGGGINRQRSSRPQAAPSSPFSPSAQNSAGQGSFNPSGSTDWGSVLSNLAVQGMNSSSGSSQGYQNRSWTSPNTQNMSSSGNNWNRSWTSPNSQNMSSSGAWGQGNSWNRPNTYYPPSSSGYNGNYNYRSSSPPQSYSYSAPQAPGYSPGYTPPVVYSNQPIKISMPTEEIGVCGYVLSSGSDSWNYTMAPGKSQSFNEDREWKIVFDRGDGRGTQTYALKPGHYRFRNGAGGWELYKASSMSTESFGAPPPPM